MDNPTFMNNPAQPQSKMRMTSYVILLMIVLVLAAIVYVLYGFSSDGNAPNESSSTAKSSAMSRPLVPVQSIGDAASACNSAYSDGDTNKFCNEYRKVNFDGLEVLINCADELLANNVPSTLDCSIAKSNVTQICDEMNLNETEFVSAGGTITTCAEARLG